MEVINNVPTNPNTFGGLRPGQTFLADGHSYMKTTEHSNGEDVINAVSLNGGILTVFLDATIVQPIATPTIA